jgi:hypothetical protein
MIELLVVTVVFLGVLYVHKFRENKDLAYQVDLDRRIRKYEALPEIDRLQAVRELIETYDCLKKRIYLKKENSLESYIKRSETISGKITNKATSFRFFPSSLGNLDDDEKEMWLLYSLLNSIDLPPGLTNQELAVFSRLENK